MIEFGLKNEESDILKNIIRKYIIDGLVIVYGSRAKGNYTERSDIDLVIKGATLIDDRILESIKDEVIESDFPYLIDIQFYESIKNPALLEHIDRVGKTIFN